MAKILVLAKSGFGKTTSYCGREKLGIKGLDPPDFRLNSISPACTKISMWEQAEQLGVNLVCNQDKILRAVL